MASNVEYLRIPPHSIEAEQAVLGALLVSNAAYDRVADVIGTADFYRGDHRAICATILALIDQNDPADVLTVSEALRAAGRLQDVGGMAYLHQLAHGTPGAANIRRYAEIVRDRAIKRRLAQVGESIAAQAMDQGSRDVRELLDHAEKAVLEVGNERAARSNEFQAVGQLLPEVLQKLDDLARNPASVTGVATGFVDLDEETAGLQRGDLIVIAGRPSMGKTALAMNIAEHVAVECSLPVIIFSMEMSGQQLAQRLLGSIAAVDSKRIRTGRVDASDWDRLGGALSKLTEAPIHIDESGALTVMELRARARRKKRECGGIGLVVIDYLQLMAGGEDSENRATEIAEITRSLKAMAKELDCPVIALSQLNRSLEARANKRPVMADLRESGAIEQDADLILFIYRDEVYNDASPDKGLAEIIIGKQRNGGLGTVKLTFHGWRTRFLNYAGNPDGYTPRAPKKPARKPFTDKDE